VRQKEGGRQVEVGRLLGGEETLRCRIGGDRPNGISVGEMVSEIWLMIKVGLISFG
jgi:hypothetical protein